MKIFGKIVDIHGKEIFQGSITIDDGKISQIQREEKSDLHQSKYIMPGLIDSHIHIESSMLTPGAFAREAVSRGTTAVVSDPHEIANILGINGITYMINDAKKVPLKFFFGAPSCVPATPFETSGARIGPDDIGKLLEKKEIKYMSEMMNFPGVIYEDEEVMEKIRIAKKAGKLIDGHAPGLSGESLEKYINAGISTDHECSTIEEAQEKINLGMKILVREGSAARNLKELKPLFISNPESIMLCSDDLHPETLVKRHLDKIVADLVNEGYNFFDVLRSCTLNPAVHYGLDTGLLRNGDPADFIIVDDIKSMNVIETWIDGQRIYADGKPLFVYNSSPAINIFNSGPIHENDIIVRNSAKRIRVIRATDGELITGEIITDSGRGKNVETDINGDILKIVVKDRYNDRPPAVGFINGFRLTGGALASSVAHDSHNIISVGTSDEDIVKAINEIVRIKGGLAVYNGKSVLSLNLPVGGIMSDRQATEVADEYRELNEMARSMGCPFSAPFMTLSFMALLVIPELKISDQGLFDGRTFKPVSLFV